MRFLIRLSPLLGALLLGSCDKLKFPAPEAAAAEGGGVHELAADDYEGFIAAPGQLVIVDFYADWCGPCRVLGPVLEKVAGEYGDQVKLGKINVDQAGELAGRLGVSSIPDVRLYRDGLMVDQFIGAIPEAEVRDRVRRHTFGLGAKSRATPGKDGEPGEAEPAIQPMKKDWIPSGIERK